jgi:hypothetical protein
MFGKDREITLDGGPPIDWLLLLLSDIDQRFVPRIPNGRDPTWVEPKKALAVCLEQSAYGRAQLSSYQSASQIHL